MHHYELAKHLFYQLALFQFGGMPLAKLGPGGCGCVDIQQAVEQVTQLEDVLFVDDKPFNYDDLLPVSEPNALGARQVTECLLGKANMLEEYFSIAIEQDDQGRAVLTGLPVLLEGYVPSPHGLPLFLLRLATEVDWTEERACFEGICRELGAYYAHLPEDEHLLPHVRHATFPAISALLYPPSKIPAGSFQVLTNLTKLYKVFERC
jgi:DNA mismatch repair protein MLH1